MSWHTPGPGSNKHRTGPRPVNTTTGATCMRDHRRILHEQALERNKLTPPERTKRYRTDPKFREHVDETFLVDTLMGLTPPLD